MKDTIIMSNIALLERPTTLHPHLSADDRPAPRSPRGFALYVGIDEVKAAAAGVSLPLLVDALRRTLAELAPDAETHATAALAPSDAGGRDLDVVRLALHEPGATARRQAEPLTPAPPESVVLDFSRKRVLIGGQSIGVTFTEIELLHYLVTHEGRTVERAELIAALWGKDADGIPAERTIDVHVRRLRAKLGSFEDIVRTVRGAGYRFDRHADVETVWAETETAPGE